ELMGIVREHVAEEDNAMFPEAEQILADQLEALMDHMVQLKQQLTPSPQQKSPCQAVSPERATRAGGCSPVSHLFDVGIKTRGGQQKPCLAVIIPNSQN